MVTSNKQSDKKVVKMAEPNNSAVVPQRTLLGEVNEHITCPLCRGYYIDATTIVECLHSFCRSCIIKHLQVKSYCPVCEMMINSAKPNIKLDKALQDIVYKLVPGLFQREMERRQQFYASRPGPAASATPEQRGEDTERIIFSPEDVISFSLEYSDITDSDSISSKSSDSNEPHPTAATRRYLQCPAVVNINHLKKFLSMKFDIDSTQFAIDILYKRVPLPDYYTLMDIAYIYNWKRNEPMRFFYQIIDYVAFRNRLFDIKRKGPQFPDRKSSPTGTEETNTSSPAPHINDQGSEISSGTNSPMPDENNLNKAGDTTKSNETHNNNKENSVQSSNKLCQDPFKKNDDEVEKSQFLNSFELTAKNSTVTSKVSPIKTNIGEQSASTNESLHKSNTVSIKNDDTLKRKLEAGKSLPEFKKVKIELEKTKIPVNQLVNVTSPKNSNTPDLPMQGLLDSEKSDDNSAKGNVNVPNLNTTNLPMATKEIKHTQSPNIKQHLPDASQKRSNIHNSLSPKRKYDSQSSVPPSLAQKTVSPLKLHLPKSEPLVSKPPDTPKLVMKKMPDLKPSGPHTPTSQNKGPPMTKLRMDLLANNCDPTIDRSKILSQVKTSLPVTSTPQTSGDPLKSLFDSCKINIPSSLSITLTDQKLDPRSPTDQTNLDSKKSLVNKNLSSASSSVGHKVPSPPVHNYIEILKLPETDPKKSIKSETNEKTNVTTKIESNTAQSKPIKSTETSAKGPVPNLKPIADTKLGKHISVPITFQQTFEQQLMKSDKKSKISKTKMQVPKLVPATPKTFAANKLNNPNSSKVGNVGTPAAENKSSTALDLSTPHNIQSQLGPQHTKAFETMQSIANLAKKQNISTKPLPPTTPSGNTFPNLTNRPLSTSTTPLRIPSTNTLNQMKHDKNMSAISQLNTTRQESIQKSNQIKQTNLCTSIPSPSYQITSHSSPCITQPSLHSQTRSPSTSPKLVIAEEKQASNNTASLGSDINQSNQITSTQVPNLNPNKTVSPKSSPGPSKSLLKPIRPLMTTSKLTGIRQPITPNLPTNPSISAPADYRSQSPLISHAQHAILRHQMEIQNAWLKAQRQFDLFKNMSNMAHHNQNDYNKDKQ